MISIAILSMFFSVVNQSLLSPQISLRRLIGVQEDSFQRDSSLAHLRPLIGQAMLEEPGTWPVYLPRLDGTPFPVTTNERPYTFLVQDIGGLIDINAASPTLIHLALGSMDPDAGHAIAQSLLELRERSPFSSPEIGLMAAKMPVADILKFRHLFTIASGSRWLNPDTVPNDLLSYLGSGKSREQIIAELGPLVFKRRQVVTVKIGWP